MEQILTPSVISSIILSIVGIWLTYNHHQHAQKIEQDKIMRDLFKEFNNRYDQLNNYLYEIDQKFESLEELNKSEQAQHYKSKVIDYFNLCAEEYYWFRVKKRIDDKIWMSWHAGMNNWYRKVPAIRELWKLEWDQKSGYSSYYLSNKDKFFED